MLILGFTKCIISGRVIEKKNESARLPYVDPKKLEFLSNPEKAKEFSVRPYVLRDEWRQWKNKEEFIQAAISLRVSTFEDDSIEIFLKANDSLIYTEIPSLKTRRLEDFENLFEIEGTKEEFDSLEHSLELKERVSKNFNELKICFDENKSTKNVYVYLENTESDSEKIGEIEIDSLINILKYNSINQTSAETKSYQKPSNIM
jgi:hypothetical protein